MVTASEPVDDEAFLDQLFEEATVLLQSGRPVSVPALLGNRQHLRVQAEEQIAALRGLHCGRPTSDSWPQISGLTLEREIGRGAMGIVFLARDEALGGRVVAVKVLDGLGTRRQRERFLVEARALAKVRHDHVVVIHEVREHQGDIALVMEHIPGHSLAELLKDPTAASLGPARLAQIARDIAAALDAVHRAGILHRDIKPANILIRDDGKALLSDFGLARDPQQSMHTEPGQFVGTAAYAAPEQLRGEVDRLDPRTDVYALGATLYHALAGEPPAGTGASALVLRRLELGQVLPLRRHNRAVSRDLETIVAKAMEVEPARRYASAAALADDLERLLALRPIEARPVGFLGRMWRLARRRPAAAGLVALLACGLPALAVPAAFLAPRVRAALAREREAAFQERLAEAFVTLSEATAAYAPERLEQAARVRLEALLAEAPADVEARGGLAWLHLSKGRAAAAESLLGCAPADGPRPHALAVLLALALTRLGRAEEVGRVQATAAAPMTPFDTLVEHLLASGASSRPQAPRRSASPLRQAILISGHRRLLDFEILCRVALRDRDLEALPDFVAAMVALYPRSFAARYRAGVVMRALGRPEAALAHLDAALALAPELVTGHNSRGNALLDLGQLPAAEQSFRHAIARIPEYADAHYNLANVLHKQGRFEEALAEHAQAILYNERLERAHLNRMVILAGQGRYEELIRHGRCALALFPSADWCQWMLGRALCETGRFRDGEALLERVTVESPSEAEGWHSLGLLRLRQWRFHDALELFRQAQARGRNDTEWIAEVERIVAAEPLLQRTDLTRDEVASCDRLASELARQQLFGAAARLFRLRFAGSGRGVSSSTWIAAAAAAAQAGVGAGKDRLRLGPVDRARCLLDAETWLGSAADDLVARAADGQLDADAARCLVATWCDRADLNPPPPEMTLAPLRRTWASVRALAGR